MSGGQALSSARLRRRGGIYFAVLSVSILVGVIGVAALATARAQRLEALATTDTLKARALAQSAVELGVRLVASDSDWRDSRAQGAWVSKLPLGDGAMTIEGFDPTDATIGNRPLDPLVLRGTGQRGGARQSMEVSLIATGTPLDALKMALHCAGEIRVNSGATITLSGAPLSTNDELRNDGTINGDIECRSVSTLGAFSGSINPVAPVKPMPGSNLVSFYKGLATPITPPSTIENAAIGPGYTPWGPTNPDGLYVISINSDLTIRNTRLVGTLVIYGGGRRVTIERSVSMQPYRADYPVIVTDSDLSIQTSAAPLSEATQGTNFNPPGVPWNPVGAANAGSTNLSLADSYPCIIQGLVHTRGSLRLDQSAYVKGMILAEDNGSEAVGVYGADVRVEYDPALYASPPMGYTKAVTMSIVPGSWKQVVY
jgi:hypothetical protein